MRRNYRKEYDNYHSKPKQKKNRAKRNAARAVMDDAGKVSKGDGKDVAHKKPLAKGGSNKKKQPQGCITVKKQIIRQNEKSTDGMNVRTDYAGGRQAT